MKNTLVATVAPLMTISVCAQDISIVVSDADFQAKGYASMSISGVVTPGSDSAVRLSVVSAENQSQAVMPGFEYKRSGLSWNEPLVGSVEEIGDIEITPNQAGRWSVRLFDVMGERKLTLVAKWIQNEQEKHQSIEIKTGFGPLSRFSRPETEPLTWFDLYEKCNATPYKGDPTQWFVRAPAEGGPRFPGGLDIQSVAGFGKYSKVPAWGAAIAAGWPTTPYRWWLGTVSMANRVRHMDLATGNPHGSGGASPATLGFGVCLKPGLIPQSDIPVWTREQAEKFLSQMGGRHPAK